MNVRFIKNYFFLFLPQTKSIKFYDTSVHINGMFFWRQKNKLLSYRRSNVENIGNNYKYLYKATIFMDHCIDLNMMWQMIEYTAKKTPQFV
jgi:hypothetical protein